MNVYVNQFNTSTDRNLLPLAAGLISSYAKKELAEKCNIQIKILRERPDKTAAEYESPDILAFSCYIWNLRHSLEVARLAKLRHPNAVVVVGGPSIPRKAETLGRFFKKYPFVDIAAHGEGEYTFTEILKAKLSGNGYSTIAGISYREGETYHKTDSRERIKDLDALPSPYLDGTFDDLVKRHGELITGTIWETNRGCPFSCSFCLAEGTIIGTMGGEKRIEDVASGDLVWGWDEKTKVVIYNSVEGVIRRGTKQVLRITSGHASVEATNDHRFYTREGWKEAKDIRKGDAILFELRGLFHGVTKEQEILFPKMLAYIPSEGNGDKEGPQSGMLRECKTGSLGSHEAEQPHEATGSLGKDGLEYEEGHREWEVCSLDVYRKRKERNREDSQKEGVGAGQSNEEPGDNDARGNEVAYLTKRVRAASNSLHAEQQSSILVHGERYVLGGAVQVREEPQSGLHPFEQEDTKSGAGSRDTLAQGRSEGSGGTGRLCQQRVGDIGNLEHGYVGFINCGEGSEVCWAIVDSVEDAGEKAVYDIVGASPNPNFFANGFLAHNCDWGQATQSKVNVYGIERLHSEIDWIARNNIFYVYAADANFGIKKRDIEIARYMGDKRRNVGAPGYFMINWMKNSHVRTIEIADILRDAGIGCQVTLSMQSFDEVTLEAIKRSNIDLDTFRSLKAEYNKRGIATYSELLLGLPGETYSSFCAGVIRALSPFPRDHFNIYLCRTLENAEMSEPDYRQKYGIETRWCEVAMARRTNDNVTVNEEEEIIVATKSMPVEDWRRSFYFGYMLNCLSNLRIAHVIINHVRLDLGLNARAFIEYIIENAYGPIKDMVDTLKGFQDSILASQSSVMQVEGFGKRYWEPHEAAYLVASRDPLMFHENIERLTVEFTGNAALQQVFDEQRRESPILGGKGTEQTDYLKPKLDS